MTRRRGESGLVRGLLLVTLLLTGTAGCGGYAYWRASSAPDLGAAPRGPAHGADERALAVYAATQFTLGLASGHLHATVALSEQDLTVILRSHTGQTPEFSDPQARVRGGLIVVDGRTTWGPLSVVGVGRLAASLVTGPDGQPDVGLDITEIDAGSLTLPAVLRNAIADQIKASAQLDALLASSQLRAIRPDLDCVAVTGDALVLGVHAPEVAPMPGACGGG